jgi:hypothetical protein
MNIRHGIELGFWHSRRIIDVLLFLSLEGGSLNVLRFNCGHDFEGRHTY